MCHAELNAILNYRGSKKDLENAKIYVDLFPCNECAKIIIQSGIKEVIYLSDKYANSENNIASRHVLEKANFKLEGIKRNARYSDNQLHNLYVYSFIRSDL